MKKHNLTSCAPYALECSSLLESFNARFEDIKSKQLELDICSVSFNVIPAPASLELQLEFIKLQDDDKLKAMYQNKPLLEFYCVYVSKEKFLNLEADALQCLSVFESTNLCEQFFSTRNITKNCCRSRLTDENLSMLLKVVIWSVRPNTKRLVKKRVSKNLTMGYIGKASLIFH